MSILGLTKQVIASEKTGKAEWLSWNICVQFLKQMLEACFLLPFADLPLSLELNYAEPRTLKDQLKPSSIETTHLYF